MTEKYSGIERHSKLEVPGESEQALIKDVEKEFGLKAEVIDRWGHEYKVELETPTGHKLPDRFTFRWVPAKNEWEFSGQSAKPRWPDWLHRTWGKSDKPIGHGASKKG